MQSDRAAAQTEMNESLRRRLGGDIRSRAAEVPVALLPPTGLPLHAAASTYRGRRAASKDRKRYYTRLTISINLIAMI